MRSISVFEHNPIEALTEAEKPAVGAAQSLQPGGSDFIGSKTVKLGEGNDAEERTAFGLKPIQPDAAFVEALKKLAAP